jgi:hypothetical protein
VGQVRVVHYPVEEDRLQDPGLVNEVGLLLDQIAYHHVSLEDLASEDDFVWRMHIHYDVSDDVNEHGLRFLAELHPD